MADTMPESVRIEWESLLQQDSTERWYGAEFIVRREMSLAEAVRIAPLLLRVFNSDEAIHWADGVLRFYCGSAGSSWQSVRDDIASIMERGVGIRACREHAGTMYDALVRAVAWFDEQGDHDAHAEACRGALQAVQG